MAENSSKKSGMSGTVLFTLPISCQICLGKVKQPVVCSNNHVFCEPCLQIWLERSPLCPTCRDPISQEKPYKKVLGGLSSHDDNSCNDSFSNPDLRRARIDLLAKDYEDEIDKCQCRIDELEAEVLGLKAQQNTTNGRSNAKSETSEMSANPIDPKSDMSMLVVLNKKLQDVTCNYTKLKKETSRMKERVRQLTDENVNLVRENQRLRIDLANRSPHKFGRYTVAAQQSKIDNSERENKQLQRALEKSDSYIEELEKELKLFRSGEKPQSEKEKLTKPEIIQPNDAKKNLFNSLTPPSWVYDLVEKTDGKKDGHTNKVVNSTFNSNGLCREKSEQNVSRSKENVSLTHNDSFHLEMPSPITPSIPLSRLNITSDSSKVILSPTVQAGKHSPLSKICTQRKLFNRVSSDPGPLEPGCSGWYPNDDASPSSPIPNSDVTFKSGLNVKADIVAKSLIDSVSSNPVDPVASCDDAGHSKPSSSTCDPVSCQSDGELDSSMTPEFSDCLKLMQEASKKVSLRKKEDLDCVDGSASATTSNGSSLNDWVTCYTGTADTYKIIGTFQTYSPNVSSQNKTVDTNCAQKTNELRRSPRKRNLLDPNENDDKMPTKIQKLF